MIKEQKCINNIFFEELHLRHINLLIDLKNNSHNNWFYKMAIINTFDDIKTFLSNMDKIKQKCIIAIENKKIVGFIYTYPLNEKKSCIQINSPNLIENNISSTQRSLILELIRKSIKNTDLRTSSWIINSEINNLELISCARELGFQPLQEVKLWSKSNRLNKTPLSNKKLDKLTKIDKENIQKILNFVRSNESILIRNILDLNQKDIYRRNDKFCGSILFNNEIIFTVLKDLNYLDDNVYSLTRGTLWDSRITTILKNILEKISTNNPRSLLKTYSNDNELYSFLTDLEYNEERTELILVRNNLIKREIKAPNKINNSIDSILQKINPQGNVYPSPFPIQIK
tara:strand:+ start:9160 stop:10188 length:1029 start_codon:yes stop_codon:yes gene_type:complete